MEDRVFLAVEAAIKEALRDYGDRISIDSDEAVQMTLALAMRSIIDSYSITGLDTEDATQLDFSDAAHRWAYAYLYVSSHTHMVNDTLGDFWRLSSALDSWHNALRGRPMRVCCVGGGPGSDLLGVSLFVKKQRLHVAGVRVDILDQWMEWEETFLGVVSKLDPGRDILPEKKDVTYHQFCFNQDSSWPIETIEDADLVTMVKFVSAASADREICQDQLTTLLQHMKESAVLFVLDNSGGGYSEMIARSAEEAGLDKLIQVCHKDLQLNQAERAAMGRSTLCHKHSIRPQTTSKVSASLWKKGPTLTAYNNFYQRRSMDDFQTHPSCPYIFLRPRHRSLGARGAGDTTTMIRSSTRPTPPVYNIAPPRSASVLIPSSGTYAMAACKSKTTPYLQNSSSSSSMSLASPPSAQIQNFDAKQNGQIFQYPILTPEDFPSLSVVAKEPETSSMQDGPAGNTTLHSSPRRTDVEKDLQSEVSSIEQKLHDSSASKDRQDQPQNVTTTQTLDAIRHPFSNPPQINNSPSEFPMDPSNNLNIPISICRTLLGKNPSNNTCPPHTKPLSHQVVSDFGAKSPSIRTTNAFMSERLITEIAPPNQTLQAVLSPPLQNGALITKHYNVSRGNQNTRCGKILSLLQWILLAVVLDKIWNFGHPWLW